MSAALIELVSVGAQDVYITGEPQVSFFRQNYKRYTNFAMKPERMDYIGTFGANNEVTIPIRSKGDLMSYIWIEADGIANFHLVDLHGTAAQALYDQVDGALLCIPVFVFVL